MDQQPLINVSDYKQSKKRRKRRDLDKLLNGRGSRMRRRQQNHEFLQMESDSNSSEEDDYNHECHKNSSHKTCSCTSYFMYLNLTISLAACIACALLLWLFFITRQDCLTSKSNISQDESNIKQLLSDYITMKLTVSSIKQNLTSCTQNTKDLKLQLKSLRKNFISFNGVDTESMKNLPKEFKDFKTKVFATSGSVSHLKSLVHDIRSDLQSMRNQILQLESKSNVSLSSLTDAVSKLPAKLNRLIISDFSINKSFIDHSTDKQDAFVLSEKDYRTLVKFMRSRRFNETT